MKVISSCMGKFLHSKYNSITPYDTSGEVESLTGYIRLNTNESPYPPSPKAIEYAHEASLSMNYYSAKEWVEKAAAQGLEGAQEVLQEQFT